MNGAVRGRIVEATNPSYDDRWGRLLEESQYDPSHMAGTACKHAVAPVPWLDRRLGAGGARDDAEVAEQDGANGSREQLKRRKGLCDRDKLFGKSQHVIHGVAPGSGRTPSKI